jgi:hypothetical protein
MRYAQVNASKNYIMVCVELHSSNDNILETVRLEVLSQVLLKI